MSKVAMVTGSSRGIGKGIAERLAAEGYHLVVNYAGNADAAAETAAECVRRAKDSGYSVRAIPVQADVGTREGRERLLETTRSEFGRLDLLVNNAGITSIGRADVLEAKEDAYDRLMSINLKGPYFLTQGAANWMIEQVQGEEGRRPKIVTISSISAYAVSVNRGDYCMAKAALGMMTKLFAVRLAEFGINVYEICPGIIASDMTAPVKEKYDGLIADGLTPIRRWGEPSDIGEAVATIADNRFSFSTGEVFNIDGGFHIRQL